MIQTQKIKKKLHRMNKVIKGIKSSDLHIQIKFLAIRQQKFIWSLKEELSATLETEESGRCSSREVLNKSQCMEFLSAGTKKSGRCEVERWPLAEARLY